MVITAIIGSIRPRSSTANALAIVIDELEKHDNVQVHLIDPSKLQLAFGKEDKLFLGLQKKVKDSVGFVLATPEYHGSYSSAIKFILENLGYPSVLAGKPGVLLGVASGQIGAVKALEHLQSVCLHIGAIVLPGSVSVAEVHKRINEQGKCLDSQLETRIRGLAKNLLSYIDKHICLDASCDEKMREVT